MVAAASSPSRRSPAARSSRRAARGTSAWTRCPSTRARTRWSRPSASTTPSTRTSAPAPTRAARSASRSRSSRRRRSARGHASSTRTSPDKGPYPIPAKPKIEGGGDRHMLLVQRGTCRLFELFAAERRGSGWRAGSGAIFNLRSNAAAPAGLDERRRRRPADPPRPRPLRRGRAGEIRHALRFTVVAHAQARSSSPRATSRPPDRPGPARDGPAPAAEGEREDRRPAAPGADRRHRAEALRDARRRQRLGLVHLRRARPGLGQRRPARAQAPAGRDFEAVR